MLTFFAALQQKLVNSPSLKLSASAMIDDAESHRQYLRNQTADGEPDDYSDTTDPRLIAACKERDTLSAHFATVLSGHARRRQALLAWGVSHCGWDVA